MTLRKIRRTELEEHNKEGDLWVVINGFVYDLTKFWPNHPGGPENVLQHAGKDGTDTFVRAVHPDYAKEELETYKIGEYEQSKMFTKIQEIADHN